MELQDALLQVSEIRQQLARSETFRGYRALPAALSAVVALVAAVVQPTVVGDPSADPGGYLALWVTAAFLSLAICASEMIVRCVSSASPLRTRQTLLAVEQFLPCVFVGGGVTVALSLSATESAWMLPGLWGVFFSLGLFASARLLPKAILGAALYYLVCGLGALIWARDAHALSPWAMAVTFGGGQLLTSGILYLTLERSEARSLLEETLHDQ
ncbi:MAG: hypothetical protein ACKV0T_18755 [Planctomycetales bacterium]